MKTIFFSFLVILSMNSYSQNTEADSIRAHQIEIEIKEIKKEAGALFLTSSLAHFNGLIGLVNSTKDSDTMGPLVMFGSIGLALDVMAVIKLCHIPKKKKELRALGK